MTRGKGRERRVHQRYPVDAEAKIELQDGGIFTCKIHNICRGGVFFHSKDSEVYFAAEKKQVINMEINLPAGNKNDERFFIGCELVRQETDGMGARFTGINSDKLSKIDHLMSLLLKEKKREQKTTKLDIPSDGDPDFFDDVFRADLNKLIDSLLQGVLSKLWVIGEKSESNQDRSSASVAAATLTGIVKDKKYSQLFQSLICKNKQNNNNANSSNNSKDPSADRSEMELIDQDEFEIWLAKSSAVNHIEGDLIDVLRTIRKQLQKYSSNNAILNIEPKNIIEALEEVFERIGFDVHMKQVCVRTAGLALPQYLEPFYKKISDRLGESEHAKNKFIINSEHKENDSFLREPTEEVVKSPEQKGVINPKPVGSTEIANAVSRLPFDVIKEEDWVNNNQQFKNKALTVLQSIDPNILNRPLDSHLEEKINSTDKVIGNMIKDPFLESQVKGWITRLSMQFLSAAVTDDKIFSHSNNSIIQVVNALEHLSMFHDPNGVGVNKSKLIDEIESIIKELLKTDVRNNSSSSKVLSKLTNLEQRQECKFRNNVKRIVSGYEGREQIRKTEKKISEMLYGEFNEKKMHGMVYTFIEENWRSLLLLVFLRKGINSIDWKKYWKAMVGLHMACGGEFDKPEIHAKQDVWLNLKEGLSYVGYDPIIKYKLLENLKKISQLFSLGKTRDKEYTIYYKTQKDIVTDTPTKKGNSAFEKILNNIDHLDIGASMICDDGSFDPLLRFVWKSRDGNELVFVTPQGTRAKSIRRLLLAKKISKGSVRLQAPLLSSIAERANDATFNEMQERINYHETHNTLTGLANRSYLIATINRILTKDNLTSSQFVLSFIDMDHFDYVISTCGYSAGERLAVAVGKFLENTFDSAYCIAYMEGKRFAVLQSAANRMEAETIGDNLRENFVKLPFYWKARQFQLTASIGLVLIPNELDNPEALLSAADTACLVSKNEGGNHVTYFSEDNSAIAKQREQMKWWVTAENVLKEKRIRLRGQRIAVTKPDENISHHYEILLSVFDEKGRQLDLDGFISSAESFNLMRNVDHLVIEQALKWAYNNPEKLQELSGIAINLSGQSISDKGLVDYIHRQFNEYSIKPELVSFEVTETAAIANMEQAVFVIEGIKNIGCFFALDDFGTGMSSYSYLKRLPIDYLKIDGSFVKDIIQNQDDLAIVKSINEIAHFMGKKTIAEYVENNDIRQCLYEVGVDYVQGYGVEKPIFLDELAQC